MRLIDYDGRPLYINENVALYLLTEAQPSEDALDHADCTLEEAGLEEQDFDTVTSAQQNYYRDEL